jgi:hypothetical protein
MYAGFVRLAGAAIAVVVLIALEERAERRARVAP